MNATLEQIKEAQKQLNEMIANFEKSTIAINFPLTIKAPETKVGEQYVGAVISADGTQCHHIILLAESREDINWKDAMEWAKSIGGDLPNRCESALLFATKKDQFVNEWHWTNEQHAGDSDYAWMQGFDNGYQNLTRKPNRYRARAVRRVLIQEGK